VPFKPSRNPKVEELTKSVKERSYMLDAIRPIKLEELNSKGKPRKLCAWCCEGDLDGRQKYCGKNCAESAEAHFYPQKEQGLKFLLERQDWKCAICQFDYLPVLQEITKKDRVSYTDGSILPLSPETLSWYTFKRLKRKVDKANRPEVDHIVPIYKGGESLGLENHQAICFTCHKAKTKRDLSGPRNSS
jgi:hypothetical protein